MIEFLFNTPGNADPLRLADVTRINEWFSAAGWAWWQLGLASIAAAIIIGWSLRGAGIRSERSVTLAAGALSVPRRAMIGLLQWMFVTLLLLMLWQPAIRHNALLKGDNTIAVLIDRSRSMTLPSETSPTATRLQQSLLALNDSAGSDPSVLNQLEQRFSVALKTFDATVRPASVDENQQLTSRQFLSEDTAPGEASRFRYALMDTLSAASQSLLAGVIVISDGADTDPADASFWQSLRAASVPVYPVGVGDTDLNDLQITHVEIPASAPADTLLTAQIELRYQQPGTTVLRVTRDAELLYSGEVTLPEGESAVRHNVRFRSGDPGPSVLAFSVDAQDSEVNTVNNRHHQPLLITDRKPRVLYIEGEPRWEYKFLRRAVSAVSSVDIVSLLYTSPNKFYRQGVSGQDELSDGFPSDAQTLFQYDAIIIGSLDATLLTQSQHQLIQDFVKIRGGSLLMLAGRNGLDQGGWGTTAVGQALPVTVSGDADSYRRDRTVLIPTQAGYATDWLSLTDGVRRANAPRSRSDQWASLPEVADIQITGAPKAGATVLLTGQVDGLASPVLSWQRYGRGRAFVLATSGTWRWQMSLPADDSRHEHFWAGLLGELSDGVLPGIGISPATRVVRDRDTLAIQIDARTEGYLPDTNPTRITVTAPDDTLSEVSVVADPGVPGQYRANIPLLQTGLYSVDVAALSDATGVEGHSAQLVVLREENTAEDFALAQDDAFLKEVAQVSGGTYLTLESIGQIPELVEGHSATQTRETIYHLWSMPVFFLVLMLLKIAEWLLRRSWNRL